MHSAWTTRDLPWLTFCTFCILVPFTVSSNLPSSSIRWYISVGIYPLGHRVHQLLSYEELADDQRGPACAMRLAHFLGVPYDAAEVYAGVREGGEGGEEIARGGVRALIRLHMRKNMRSSGEGSSGEGSSGEEGHERAGPLAGWGDAVGGRAASNAWSMVCMSAMVEAPALWPGGSAADHSGGGVRSASGNTTAMDVTSSQSRRRGGVEFEYAAMELALRQEQWPRPSMGEHIQASRL
jgi:hypothetical protein